MIFAHRATVKCQPIMSITDAFTTTLTIKNEDKSTFAINLFADKRATLDPLHVLDVDDSTLSGDFSISFHNVENIILEPATDKLRIRLLMKDLSTETIVIYD